MSEFPILKDLLIEQVDMALRRKNERGAVRMLRQHLGVTPRRANVILTAWHHSTHAGSRLMEPHLSRLRRKHL